MSGNARVFQNRLTDTSLKDVVGVGTLRWEGNKCYKWVKYDEGDSLDIVVGDVLAYKATSYNDNVVTADLSEGDTIPTPAGIALSTVTVDLTYMWIQIKGFATLSLDVLGSSPGNGEALGAGLTGGTDKAAIVDPADNQVRFGANVDDSSKTCVLDCPF